MTYELCTNLYSSFGLWCNIFVHWKIYILFLYVLCFFLAICMRFSIVALKLMASRHVFEIRIPLTKSGRVHDWWMVNSVSHMKWCLASFIYDEFLLGVDMVFTFKALECYLVWVIQHSSFNQDLARLTLELQYLITTSMLLFSGPTQRKIIGQAHMF